MGEVADIFLVVGTLCLLVFLNVMVVVALTDLLRVVHKDRKARETMEGEEEKRVEVYPVKSIGEEPPFLDEAAELAGTFRMSRYAATPDEIIAGILREDELKEKRSG